MVLILPREVLPFVIILSFNFFYSMITVKKSVKLFIITLVFRILPRGTHPQQALYSLVDIDLTIPGFFFCRAIVIFESSSILAAKLV